MATIEDLVKQLIENYRKSFWTVCSRLGERGVEDGFKDGMSNKVEGGTIYQDRGKEKTREEGAASLVVGDGKLRAP